MKIILTIQQLKTVLMSPESEVKYPITIKMNNISKAEIKELTELIKKKG